MFGIRRGIKAVVLRTSSARRAADVEIPIDGHSGAGAQLSEAPSKQRGTMNGDASKRVGSPVSESVPVGAVLNKAPNEPGVFVDGDFWGPVDNESAREKALGKQLEIDRNECIGCGTCVENTEQVFFLNDDECKAYVIAQEGDMELVQDAIDACPVTCISWQ